MKKKIPIVILSFVFAIIIWSSVNISGSFYTTLRLPLKISNVRDGYGLASTYPETLTVKLKAVGWKILRLHLGRNIEYVASAGLEVGNIHIKLMNSLTDNDWVTSDVQVLDVWPSAINMKIDKLETRMLPVSPDVTIDFKEEFGLAVPVSSIPDSVMVSGTHRFLDTMKNVKTALLYYSKLDQSFSTEVELVKSPLLNIKPGKVNLHFDVQKIVEREVGEVPIRIVNLPPGRNIVILPDRISILLRGGINILGKLNTQEIYAEVNYHDIVADTVGSIRTYVKTPPNIKLVYKDPDRVKYIIKEF